ncbi:ParB N-terminal domain-containing protein (plasmid) [Streptomyces sp. NBC_01310]|uniref:ParB/RepB/Spo0J family partition protein n=1 Tax=Streptomyces sp. NBC_01310 TaxID=2903820 RepID=UPI0035B5DE87|nr:ParB N-terminal domain-containing protein [Streptomyces sp. NBC_01310]
MTVTTEQTPETGQQDEQFIGRLILIDPLHFDPEGKKKDALIVIDPFNHRKKRTTGEGDTTGEEDTTQPDPALIASVEALGVQQAIILRPQVGENAGKLGIVIGQRRTTAAHRVAAQALAEGRSYRKVPAIVRDDLQGVDDEALTISMVENIHRKQATAQDDLEAAQQLALMVNVKRVPKARKQQMAAAIGRTVEELDAAHKVAQLTPETLEDIDADEVDFDWVELGDLQEVEDVNGALTTLWMAKARDEAEGNSKRGAWKQAMETLRAQKARKERVEQARAGLTDRGVKVVRFVDNWQRLVVPPTRPLDELLTEVDRPLTEQVHEETCPGHAAAVNPEDGEVVWLCVDWKKNGHKLANEPEAADAGSAEVDEKAAARAKEEDEKKEAEREHGRVIRKNNDAWRVARTVREAHIADMCKEKSEAPAAVKDLVMRTLLAGGSHVGQFANATEKLRETQGQLLSKFLADDRLSRVGEDVISALITRTAAKRYWWVLFAYVAAMHEAMHMKDDAWRGEPHYHYGHNRPNHDAGPIRPATVEWINFLKTYGYSPSEIEEQTLALARQQAEEQAEREAREAEAREARKAEREAREAAAAAEAETEAETEAEAETEPDAEAEAETEPDAEAEAETEPDAEAEAETEPDADAEAETEAETDAEAETEPETEPETDAEPETEPETQADADAEPETQADADAEPDAEADAE